MKSGSIFAFPAIRPRLEVVGILTNMDLLATYAALIKDRYLPLLTNIRI
jgi:hypothetical protein